MSTEPPPPARTHEAGMNRAVVLADERPATQSLAVVGELGRNRERGLAGPPDEMPRGHDFCATLAVR